MTMQATGERLLQLLDAAAAFMSDKPDENLEDMQNALDEYVEESEDRIKAEYERGFLIFETKGGKEQFEAFMFDPASGLPVTFQADVKWILLGKDYLILRNAGMAPILESEQRMQFEKQAIAQQNQAAIQQAQMTMQMPPQPQEAQRMPYWMWAEVLELRPIDWEIMTGRFKDLWKRYGPEAEQPPAPEAGY
jgi:hypothetical protein